MSDLHNEMRQPISTWLSQIMAASTACLQVTNHEDDQDGDVVREVLHDAGGGLKDPQIEELTYAIGYVAEIIKGAGQARREQNPELATELERLAASIREANLTFLMSEAGNAILGGAAWPEDPDQ